MVKVNRHTLSNGLRMVHSADPSTAMVALTITYATGARDENPAHTGLAHLFEHMMFAGSANVPDYDAQLSEAGGENNAFTSNDFTTYYAIIPSHNAETAFRLESDRMLRPSLGMESLQIQRAVVIEEFKQQCLNRPYGDLSHHLMPMIYPAEHPYSWPTIGICTEHIANLTREDLLAWFDDHYAPSNAVLAVTGNISFEKARELAEKWFGTIPARPAKVRHIPEITPPAKTVTKTVYGNVPATSITVAYLMPDYYSPISLAADALTDLLADGRASLFFNRFMRNPDSPFSEADASILASEHQGLLLLNTRLSDEDINIESAIEQLIAAAKSVLDDGITPEQLERIKNKRQAATMMSMIDYAARGQRLAVTEIHGEQPFEMLDRYMALTAEDILNAARTIMDTPPAILVYRPEKTNKQASDVV